MISRKNIAGLRRLFVLAQQNLNKAKEIGGLIPPDKLDYDTLIEESKKCEDPDAKELAKYLYARLPNIYIMSPDEFLKEYFS